MDGRLILLVNVIAFALPYIIIFSVLGHFANKNNIPFKVALKFNDYVKNTIGMVAVFQFVFLIIDLVILLSLSGTGYSIAENATIVIFTNVLFFEPALALTALDNINRNTRNIKKLLPSLPIKF